MELGVPGRLAQFEPALLTLPHMVLSCWSFWQCSCWLENKWLSFFDRKEEEVQEEDDEEEEEEREVPFPEELSPGCGAILGQDFRMGRYFLERLGLEVASLWVGGV